MGKIWAHNDRTDDGSDGGIESWRGFNVFKPDWIWTERDWIKKEGKEGYQLTLVLEREIEQPNYRDYYYSSTPWTGVEKEIRNSLRTLFWSKCEMRERRMMMACCCRSSRSLESKMCLVFACDVHCDSLTGNKTAFLSRDWWGWWWCIRI